MSDHNDNAQDKGNDNTVTLDTMSLDQFESKLNSDPVFQKEYLDNPTDPKYARLNEAYGRRVSGMPDDSPPQEAAQAQPAASQTAGTDTTIDTVDVGGVVIPRELFGTYLTNRSPAEALLEALKGNEEKDKYITSLRSRSTELMDEAQSLRSQLEALRSKPQPQAAADDVDVTAMDLDSVDLFVPEDQDKVKKVIKGLTAKVQQLQQATSQPVVQNPAESYVRSQYQDIEDLQLAVPELQTSIPFEKLDKEMRFFYDSIAQLSGKNIDDAWTMYHDQGAQGEAFRAKCAQAKIVLPPEHTIHSRVMDIKAQRDADLQQQAEHMTKVLRAQGKLGEQEQFTVQMLPQNRDNSYRAYWLRQAQATVPQVPVQPQQSAAPAQPAINPALQAQIDARREQQAQPYAPTVPHDASTVPISDVSQLPAAEFQRIHVKFQSSPSSLTDEEARIYADVHDYSSVPYPLDLKRRLNIA